MYEMFSKEKTYILPNGKSYTGLDLFENSQYPLTNFDTCVVDVKNGMVTSFGLLNDLAENYGIDISEKSYDDIILEINAIILSINRNQVTKELRSNSMLKVAQITALSFTDEQAIEVVDLYPEYEINHSYKKDDRFQYGGTLYKVNQAHTSQEQWVPGTVGTESLYTNLMLNDAGYQIWKQPTGAHDAYNTGDIVEYKGTLYKSLINGNAWAPDVYPAGWQEYDESTSTEPGTPEPGTPEPGTPEPGTPDPGTETYPDFVQPTGAHDAYKKGDIVRYNGKLYQSLIDANAYSPDAYPQGWQEYSEE